MDVRRVVEVWDPGAGIAGTGYLVTDRLVLTAFHNVRGPARAVEVRRLAPHGQRQDGWAAAEVLWPERAPDLAADPHTDAALLLVTDTAWQPPDPPLPAVRWGRLPPPADGMVDTRVPCVAVGFPEAEQRDGRRDTKQISGHIETLSGLKSGLLTAHVDRVATPGAGTGSSPWSGASGAALFCGELLTGVLTTDRAGAYSGDQLVAVPLATLAARPGFTTTLKAAGNAVALEVISPRAERTGPYDVDVPAGLHNLPSLPTQVFVGRDEALTTLATALEQGSQAVTQTVQGLGGVGKTTLALHYAHAYRDAYHLVWWVGAETPEQLTTDLAALTTRVNGGPTGRTTTEDAAWAVGWLQTHPGWLLVLDNAERPDTVAHLTGQLHHAGRHLITTRFAHGWPTTPLALPLLTADASLDLLTRLTGLTDADDQHHARLLADELGHLPLALEQAGAFIAESHLAVGAYLDLLHRHPAETTNTGPAGTDPQRTMARIWRITLDALHRDTPLAVDILRTVAWFAPDAIPRDLLLPMADTPVEYARALGRLASYGMISLDSGTFSVHRLVQRVARTPDVGTAEDTDPHRAAHVIATARHRATVLLASALPDDPHANVAGWPTWRALLPHTQALLAGTAPEDDSEATHSLLSITVVYLDGQGQITEAIGYSRRSLTASSRLHGPDDPRTLTARNNLACVYQAGANLNDAIALHEQNLADRTRVLGEDHPHTLTSRDNLARAYAEAGDLPRAVTLSERSRADFERLLGGDHPDTLTSRNNLAHVYQAAGDPDRAIALYEWSLADRTRVLGTDHPSTLITRNNLACAYLAAGDPLRAIAAHEQNLADRTRIMGEDHPDTLISRNNLGFSCQAAGDLDRAISLYEQSLTGRTRVLGESHPDTLVSRRDLASAHRAAGHLDRATTLYAQALTGAERFLQADHSFTLDLRNDLADAHRAAGNPSDAIALHEQNLSARTRVLGEDHPDTLTSRNNLAYAYQSAGDLDRATALYELNLAVAERALRADHPHTRVFRANLAHARQAGEPPPNANGR
ncbi:tetratricopeptide repeat protein [Streptomyces sp. NPDC048182]|uniref:tetratricopeptide repeat protein n=1 Tax=Streptomyces sp. NPDC048182 TaxID=3365507 RepID=UPI00371E27E1